MHRFRLEGRLGNGSYSDVFRAVNIESGEQIALKIMKQSYQRGKHAQDMQLFTLRKFAFVPTVVPLLESFIHEGHLNLVFELLEINLIDYYKELRTKESRDLSAGEIKSVLYQICLALDAMHREGYAHRDIKPQNVLIRAAGPYLQAKLTDFGLTKKLDKVHNTNYVATRWYRSPELLLNMRYDLSVDVFALGCLMVELYLGFEPFPGNDTIDQLNKIFAILGTPTGESWPEGYHFIQEKGIFFHNYEQVDLESNIPGVCQEGLDLIQRILVNNPRERLTTSEILAHPYFYDVKGILPPKVMEYVRRQQDIDMHRPRSSQSAKSAAWPTVPRLNGVCFGSMVNPINEIRSEIKSSEKSTDSTYLRQYNTPRDQAIYLQTDQQPMSREGLHIQRVQSSDPQYAARSRYLGAAANLSNSVNNVKVSFEVMEQPSFQNKSNNVSAAPPAINNPASRSPQRAAPIAEVNNNGWQSFTRQSPSVVINYTNRQQQISQPIDYSTIRKNSPGFSAVRSQNPSIGPSQSRPNFDRSFTSQQPLAANQRIQQRTIQTHQPVVVASQRQPVHMQRHHESKLQFTMQNNFHSDNSRSASRSPNPHNPVNIHFANAYRQEQRPSFHHPPPTKQNRPPHVNQTSRNRQVSINYFEPKAPPIAPKRQLLRVEQVGSYVPTPTSTKNSMSSLIYYNQPSSNSCFTSPNGTPHQHLNTVVSVKEPAYSQLNSQTATPPYEEEQQEYYQPSMCDAICDYFYVDAEELEYTIGERNSYRQSNQHNDNGCCRPCCLPQQ